MKPEEIAIRDFSGGFTTNLRSRNNLQSQIVTNFDIFTDPNRLIPYYHSEDGDANSSTSQKQNFDVGLWVPGGDYRVFGLGVVSSTTKAEINMKKMSIGGTNDFGDNGWLSPVGNASGSGATDFNLFRYYKKTGKFYGAKAGTTIWSFTPDGSTAFNDTEVSIAYTSMGQGIVHSKDDILYVPYDNKIATNNNGSWTVAALTISTKHMITSISEYQNYLAIACAPVNGVGNSVVLLWDRNSSLVTLSETIDWGAGIIKVIEEIEGSLVGIIYDADINQGRGNNFFRFRYFDGTSEAKQFECVQAPSLALITVFLSTFKQKVNNRVYFMAAAYMNGTLREGVFSIGKNSHGAFALAHERTPNNDTGVLSNSGSVLGFIIVGGFTFIAYKSGSSSSTFALSKTDDQAAYGAGGTIQTAIYESMKLDFNDATLKKSLEGVAVTFEPLPSGASVTLKYRQNGDTAWTTIFTESNLNEISHDSIGIDGGAKIVDFKEIQFQILSTGGAVITGLFAKASYNIQKRSW